MSQVLVILGLVFSAISLTISGEALTRANALRQQRLDTESADRIHLLIDAYFNEYHVYPNNLDQLAATQGYDAANLDRRFRVRYAVAKGLKDSIWTYDRAIVFVNPNTLTDAEFLAANGCGSNDFFSNGDWCQSDKFKWKLSEGRLQYPVQIQQSRRIIDRTMLRFSDYFNAYGEFPTKANDGSVLVPSKAYQLPLLAGYAGAPSNCTGIFHFDKIALTCDDFFSFINGAEVDYVATNNQSISLLLKTQVMRADGTFVTLAQQLRI